MQDNVYKNPQAGQPLITTISSACKTPMLPIKFSNVVNPYYYANSPTVPRYSITCLVDPEKNKEFLKGIQTIEKNEKVDTIIKNDFVKQNGECFTTGNVLIKFQGKDRIPVYRIDENNEPQLMTLEDELAKDENIVVVYDILRYTKKNTMKAVNGISFRPSCIYYYASKKDGE